MKKSSTNIIQEDSDDSCDTPVGNNSNGSPKLSITRGKADRQEIFFKDEL